MIIDFLLWNPVLFDLYHIQQTHKPKQEKKAQYYPQKLWINCVMWGNKTVTINHTGTTQKKKSTPANSVTSEASVTKAPDANAVDSVSDSHTIA